MDEADNLAPNGILDGFRKQVNEVRQVYNGYVANPDLPNIVSTSPSSAHSLMLICSRLVLNSRHRATNSLIKSVWLYWRIPKWRS